MNNLGERMGNLSITPKIAYSTNQFLPKIAYSANHFSSFVFAQILAVLLFFVI
jgi:hypothetical protein